MTPVKPPRIPNAAAEAAARIRAVLLDVDGVLTDGRLYYASDAGPLRAFHVHDGLGIKLLRSAGFEVGVISAKNEDSTVRRLRDLSVEHALLGRRDKLIALGEMETALGINRDQMAYVGDDELDLPVLRAVGLPISVRDAHWTARAAAKWVTERGGGEGAVREIADALIGLARQDKTL